MNNYELYILRKNTYVVQYELGGPLNFPRADEKMPFPMFRTNNRIEAWETVKEIQPKAKWIKVFVKGKLAWEWTP